MPGAENITKTTTMCNKESIIHISEKMDKQKYSKHTAKTHPSPNICDRLSTCPECTLVLDSRSMLVYHEEKQRYPHHYHMCMVNRSIPCSRVAQLNTMTVNRMTQLAWLWPKVPKYSSALRQTDEHIISCLFNLFNT